MITMPDISQISATSCAPVNRQIDPRSQEAIAKLTTAAKQHFLDQLVLAALCSSWGRIRA
jgi:hypothetical protein